MSLHATKRMAQRDFTEVDIRSMLMNVSSLRPDILPGRWIARSFLEATQMGHRSRAGPKPADARRGDGVPRNTMTSRYLEVTFLNGHPFAAYLHLSNRSTDVSAHTRRFAPGLVADVAADGKPIGIEITAPSKVTVAALNRALHAFGMSPVTEADLAPLSAA